MTTAQPGHGGQPDRRATHARRPEDACWRRPPEGAEVSPPSQHEEPSTPVYQGPPRAGPPPPGWRPPTVVEPVPARKLPEQDLTAIETEEREALTVSYGIGLLAGAVMIVMLVVVCARLIG